MTGTGKTVTRVDLCEAVYQKVGLSRTESSAFVELVLKEITDCLERGETVKLSSFGSFVVRKKGQRIGRNPKTGKEVPISPRRVMAAKDLGLDRIEIRRRNLISVSEMPYALAPVRPIDGFNDTSCDSGDYAMTFDRCLAEAGWADKAKLNGKLVDGRFHAGAAEADGANAKVLS